MSAQPAAPRRTPDIFGTTARLPGGLTVSFGQMLLVAAIVFYSLAVPGDLRFKLDALGFGVCHQISTHSFFVAGQQLPLCARCSGMYLGALSAILLLAFLRKRASGLPAAHMITILAVFFGAMLLDGINSTLENFGKGLWDSTNLIRLFTGALAGIAVAFMFYPMFNLSLWRKDVTSKESVLEQPFELAGYMVGAGALVALVLNGGDWLFYPISILSISGMLTLLTMAMTMLVLVIGRREGKAATPSQALTPVLIGFIMSLFVLTLIVWGRASLAPLMVNSIGMPVTPGLP